MSSCNGRTLTKSPVEIFGLFSFEPRTLEYGGENTMTMREIRNYKIQITDKKQN